MKVKFTVSFIGIFSQYKSFVGKIKMNVGVGILRSGVKWRQPLALSLSPLLVKIFLMIPRTLSWEKELNRRSASSYKYNIIQSNKIKVTQGN